MALMLQTPEKLSELKNPLDFPKCLDRITQVAVNRAIFEIYQYKIYDMFFKSGFHKRYSHDGRFWWWSNDPGTFLLK